MKKLFGGLAVLMFICLLMIVGMVEAGSVSLGLGAVMLFINCAAWAGCLYISGAFEEVEE